MTIWQRIGCRCGPRSGDSMPAILPTPGTWDNDRGQFIDSDSANLVWRRGRWEKRHDKFLKQDVISFYFYGDGYADYECTQVVVAEANFNGVE